MVFSDFPSTLYTNSYSRVKTRVLEYYSANISVQFLNEKGKLGLLIQNFMQNRRVVSEFPSTVHTTMCSLYESKFACQRLSID